MLNLKPPRHTPTLPISLKKSLIHCRYDVVVIH
jgi:hypothetical protein